MRIIKTLDRVFSRALAICGFTVVLVAIFVIQNYLFNYWLKITPGEYALRRTASTIAIGVLLFGPSILINKRFKYSYLSVVSLLVAAIFSSQYLYYSYSGGFLQISALFYARNGVNDLSTAKIFLNWRIAFFAADLIIVVIAWILVNNRKIFEEILTKKQKITAAAAVIALATLGYGYFFYIEKTDPENVAGIFKYNQLYDVNGLVSKAGIVNFSLGDAIALAMHTDKVTAADLVFAKEYEEEKLAAKPGNDFGELKGRNVIFIQVESLDNSVIRQKIGGEEITPNLNVLAGGGMYFSNYYSSVGPGTTADAEFMTMNSLYSLPDSVAFIQYPYDNYNALPGLLKQNGYGTYSFHGDLPSFWNRTNVYPQLGYKKWFSRNDYVIPRKVGNYDLGDEDFFSQSLPKLSALSQPFMATLITLTSHTPFVIPRDLQTLAIPASSNLSPFQKNYLQSVHYADRAIGDFIDKLKAAGLYDNSLIMIWGDHASSTGIASALGVNNSVFPDLQPSQVPLIILAPGSPLKGDVTAPANHLDVYPTVANLLGIKPPAYVFGNDIVQGENNLAVSRNLVSGTVKSILTNTLAFHAGSDGQFFDGECLAMPEKKTLDVGSCRSLYDKTTDAVKVSDIMVRGNSIGAQ